MRTTLLALPVLMLGGCVVVPGEGGVGFPGDILGGIERTSSGGDYRCDGGRGFSVALDRDGERARVRTDGRDYDLDYAGRERGVSRYEGRRGDDRVTLSLDDDAAYLRIEGESDYKDCRSTSAAFGGTDRRRDDDRRRSSGDAVYYRCDGGREFEAAFDRRRERVLVDVGRGTRELDLVDQDGRRRVYQDGDYRLTVERGSAYLRVEDGNDYKDCRVDR